MTIYVIIITIILIFILFFICNISNYACFNKIEGMTSSLYQYYLDHFNRSPDPIILKYYQNRNENIILTDISVYKNQVDLGRNIVKNKKLILTGLIRNAESNIPYLKTLYSNFKKICKHIVFIIVENDSSDNTRFELIEWTKQDNSIIILCDSLNNINASKCNISGHGHFYVDKIPYVTRIRKLSYLRNIYIDYIRNHNTYQSYDYLCVMDLDLNGNLFMDGILNSFYHLNINHEISGLACNGMVKGKNDSFTYYDTFAFIELGENYEWNTNFDKYSHDEDVLKYISQKYQNDMNLDQVLSAFGGFCIYNLSHVIKTQTNYSYSIDDKLSCEHVHFNKNFNKFFVNPRMIFLIYSN